MDLDEALRMVKLGEIVDAKTIIGLYAVKEMREKNESNH